MQKLFQKLHNRVLPFFLAVLMLASTLPLNVLSIGADAATEGAANGTPSPDGYIYDYDTLKITKDGKETYAMDLLTHEKITISADGVTENATYQWQIQHNEKENTWINIYDATEKELPVTLALLGNLLRDDHTAKLRCRAYTDTYAYLTSPITVTVKEPTETEITIPTQTTKNPSFKADGDDPDTPEFVTVTIEYMIVKYIKEDGEYKLTPEVEAFSPYIATLAYNSSLNTTVDNPSIVGFTPYFVEGDTETPCDEVTIDLTNIQEDVTYKVRYKPSADVPYRVQYLFQNIYDDLYSEDKTVIGTDSNGDPITGAPYLGKGTTGLPPKQGVDGIEFEGFTALYYQPDTIAADGSTAFEVYYERNYYLMEFDCDGGYGVNTVYVRYGTYASIPFPVRPGYVFDKDGDGNGWDLVETDQPGFAGTLKDNIADPLPENMPPYNTSYKAIWETAPTTYTVVYWAENANDTNYSYWGTVLVGGTRNAEGEIEPDGSVISATLVSGANHSTAPSSLKDYKHFTYNEKLTLYKESQRNDLQDGKVVVEGDGSTVVNVYFSRNVYTITFTDSSADGCQINEHQHTEECYTYICDSHVHVPTCYICGKEENPHTSACCSLAHDHASCEIGTCTHQKHDITCYTNNSSVVEATTSHQGFTTVRNTYGNPDEATIYRYCQYNYNGYYHNYFYTGGKWYYLGTSNRNTTTVRGLTWTGTANNSSGAVTKSTSANSPSLCSHIHEDACYSCGKKAHNHESGCNSVNCSDPSHHSHSAACLGCTSSHVHTSACPTALICEKGEHSHSSDSYSKRIVKILSRKYGSDIGDEWIFTTDKGTTYPKGDDISSWHPGTTSSLFSERLSLIYIMPGESFELRYDPQSGRTKKYYKYLVECLEGEEYDIQYKGRNYKYYFDFETLVVDFNYYTKAEDFFDFQGFTKQIAILDGSEIKNNGDLNKDDIVYFYYTRNQYELKYFNHNDFIKDGATDLTETLQYETPLQSYELTKAYMEANHYPSTLEPGAYEFAGWYTTAGCFDGTKVDWAKNKMPDGDLTLYAKWIPIQRNVYFFEDLKDLQAFENDDDKSHCWQPPAPAPSISYPIVVDHGTLLGTTYNYIPTRTGVDNPSDYYFVGWFYFDENGKKKFAPDSMEVDRDLYLFAEWKTSIPTTYHVEFEAWKKDSGGTETKIETIAKPLEDYSTAGKTVTFDAAGGNRLYDLSSAGGTNYREKWFPESASHSLLMDSDSGNNTYTFRYFNKEYINYKVIYKDRVTGKILGESEVKQTYKAIVTEKYKPFDNYYPEQYYIERPIAYDPTDYSEPGKENFVLEENIIYFYYVPDTEHAPYHVKHFKENVAGDGYDLAKSYQGIADLNKKITEPVSEYTGFVFDHAEVYHYTKNSAGDWVKDAVPQTIKDVNAVTGTVTLGGLDIEIYYKRIEVGYTIRYVQYGTTTVLETVKAPPEAKATFGSEVSHTSPAELQIGEIKYTYYLDNSTELDRTQSMTIRENAADNVLTFYYKEKTILVNYHVVCTVPSLADKNAVSLANERAATADSLAGSTAMPGTGFTFKGWFMEAACTTPVPNDWLVTDKHLKPKALTDTDKDEEEHFYALFEPIYGALRITKGIDGIDGTGATGATFLFRVQGTDTNNKHIDIIVSITDASPNVDTVLLNKVPIGNYTVTELTDWSWEYTTGTEECTAIVEEDKTTEVSFTNTPDPSNWLTGETVNENQFNP